MCILGLRALLIQKDAKRNRKAYRIDNCLRALLIQKDAKQMLVSAGLEDGLRALLIQKDAKHFDAYGKPSIQFESFVNSERCKTRISSLCYE